MTTQDDVDVAWPAEDEVTTFVGVCDHCGSERPVQLHVDPFVDEVYDEQEDSVWCRPCFQDRHDEV